MSKFEVSSQRKLPATSPNLDGVSRIPYKAEIQGFGIGLVKITAPLHLFTLYFFWLCFQNQIGSIETQMLILPAILFSILHIFLCICFARNNVTLTREGITLPLYFVFADFPRLSWKWEDLTALTFNRSNERALTADQFVLHFKNPITKKKVNMAFALREFTGLDLQKIIYAAVTNAPHIVVTPPLEKLSIDIPTVSGIKHLNFSNFTTLWEEEYSTRYSPTLFVPLEPDSKLRGGSITITELVACGGSAAIYSAENTEGERIIIKEAVIPKNSSEALRKKATEMFNREALLLNKLDHPYIAKVFDHFVENEHHYEVLEFIDGLDLRRFVKERGPQPVDFVLRWAEQICEILVYLHSQDPPIIHRDLTPDNLVLRVDGQIVLIDFGAANAFVGTATGTMVGKQAYMPLEQLRGKSAPQSDIFSLGGTIYFLLTGHDPKPLEQSQIGADRHLPIDINPLLAKCTAVELADRYHSAQEVLNAIQRMRQERIISITTSQTHK